MAYFFSFIFKKTFNLVSIYFSRFSFWLRWRFGKFRIQFLAWLWPSKNYDRFVASGRRKPIVFSNWNLVWFSFFLCCWVFFQSERYHFELTFDFDLPFSLKWIIIPLSFIPLYFGIKSARVADRRKVLISLSPYFIFFRSLVWAEGWLYRPEWGEIAVAFRGARYVLIGPGHDNIFSMLWGRIFIIRPTEELYAKGVRWMTDHHRFIFLPKEELPAIQDCLTFSSHTANGSLDRFLDCLDALHKGIQSFEQIAVQQALATPPSEVTVFCFGVWAAWALLVLATIHGVVPPELEVLSGPFGLFTTYLVLTHQSNPLPFTLLPPLAKELPPIPVSWSSILIGGVV